MAIKTWRAPWLYFKVQVVCTNTKCLLHLDGPPWSVLCTYIVKRADLPQFYEAYLHPESTSGYCPSCGNLGLMEDPIPVGG